MSKSLPALATAVLLAACQPPEPPAEAVVHLAERLAEAQVEAGVAAVGEERRWDLASEEGRAAWQPYDTQSERVGTVALEPGEDGLRITLAKTPKPLILGGLETTFDEPLRFEDWEGVLLRIRTSDSFLGVTITTNLDEDAAVPNWWQFFQAEDDSPPLYSDGSVQTYSIPLRPRRDENGEAPEHLRDLAVVFAATATPHRADVLGIELVPRGAAFAESAGVLPLTRGGTTRQTLYARLPARLTFPVRLPADARLDVGLGILAGKDVSYRVLARQGERSAVVLEAKATDGDAWLQQSADLAGWTGETELTLEASGHEGTVALWGAPILSGASAAAEKPNVILYVIDSGDANFMSLYGDERPTTPFLGELAREAVVFTRAHSNASWTQPSTASFMTSLHHSVLGGLRRGLHSTAVPPDATTMAEHFRRGGYTTASFTSNPNAGRVLGLQRGADVLRDVPDGHHSTSSIDLYERFREFRGAYPNGPAWVHFQTTDVHMPYEPPQPFAGRFVSAEDREWQREWLFRIAQSRPRDMDPFAGWTRGLEQAGIDPRTFYTVSKGLYEETMLHQDHALQELVTDLKARGEWQNTLLVVAADHGHPAGSHSRFGRGLIEPLPELWEGALFDAYLTRVPMLFVWPGKIAGGRTIDTPVSMIDVLPTLLDLVGLPPPEALQGQSLAPLLRGEAMEVRPVILDEFRVDETSGEMIGNLEVIDGKWGASLEIRPLPEGGDPRLGRSAVPAGGRWGAVHSFQPDVPNLLLYDLENDPFATTNVNAEHPELVEKYRRFLLEHWQAHQALATRFAPAGDTPLTPQQLEQLRALGYIQ